MSLSPANLTWRCTEAAPPLANLTSKHITSDHSTLAILGCIPIVFKIPTLSQNPKFLLRPKVVNFSPRVDLRGETNCSSVKSNQSNSRPSGQIPNPAVPCHTPRACERITPPSTAPVPPSLPPMVLITFLLGYLLARLVTSSGSLGCWPL
jgi:hypothetical protein